LPEQSGRWKIKYRRVLYMNKYQKLYLIAKTNLEVLEEKEKEIDRQYIAEHNIVNPDGSIPRATWAIRDDEIAEKAIDETARMVVKSGLWDQILKARKILKETEDNLIKYGLGIIPYQEERKTLEKAVKENYTARMKAINLILKLDTRTVKA
jgi:hypothetical protein